MKTSTLPIASVCLAGLACALAMKPTVETVNINDIKSGNVTIVGVLGRPTGEIVEVGGRWVEPADSPELLKVAERRSFHVFSIDGEELTPALVFSERDVRNLPTARSYEGTKYVAFETLRFDGIPTGAWNDGRSPLAVNRRFGAYSQLNIVRGSTNE